MLVAVITGSPGWAARSVESAGLLEARVVAATAPALPIPGFVCEHPNPKPNQPAPLLGLLLRLRLLAREESLHLCQ